MPLNQVPAIHDCQERPGEPRPRLSVVTTVRNGEDTLARAIASVRAQQMPGLEYIVIDGGSHDGTLAIIRDNADIIGCWKSEPDRGISDGFNKGIALSSGRYIALLNADDWLSPGQLAFGIETLEATGADFVFGDLFYHDSAGLPLHTVKGDPGYARRIAHVMPALNHPTIIVRRDAYEASGLFDLTLRYAMDYDLLLRLHRAGRRGVYDPRIAGHMTLAGISDRHSAGALREMRQIAIRHGYPAAAAHLLYYFRLAKDKTRRLLEGLLPARASIALRRIFNHDIASVK